ncbi:MAG TPA: hypothetical protein VD861_19710, partial [Pyrinomonadaceae bacterium]|nr:hypothetical protein [Pyrinomonadaceae bacterium]
SLTRARPRLTRPNEMDSRLLKLRSETYAAAAFHRAASEYFTALRDGNAADDNAPVVTALEEAAAVYANALDDLLAYLNTLEQTPAVSEELQRTERIRELLRRESQLMSRAMSD